jgi:hypothetical protein
LGFPRELGNLTVARYFSLWDFFNKGQHFFREVRHLNRT